MANKEEYNIICLSNQLWDFPNWTNKRHVMLRVAKRGHKVIFVDPPINAGFVFLRQLLRGFWSFKRLLTQIYLDNDSGAVIFTPINLLPWPKITSLCHILKINLLAKFLFKENRKTILWVYHVQIAQLSQYLDRIKYDLLVYDCVDNYDAFPEETSFYRTSVYGSLLREQEKMLATRANVVFASAPGLVDKLKKYNQNVFFTPNVGDYPRFKNTKSYANQLPADLAKIPKPRVGMIGAMDDYKFDAPLVRKAALENPNFSFVLIGPLGLKDRSATIETIGLSGIPNVYYLGPRPYSQKHLYMAGFDVDIIPYQLNDYTVGGCFPVKFHDSLAAGLPVVVTDLPAYAPFKDVCYISKSYDEFSKNIQKAFDEDTPERIKARQAVAKENDWDGKVAKMFDLLPTPCSADDN